MDASGDLFVADAGNSRVLRFPASVLVSGATDPAADIVIGQASFTTVTRPSGQADKNLLLVPGGLAFDAEGHLFVTDAGNRLLVFPASVSSPTATSNTAAIRLAGFVSPQPLTATASTLNNPNGVVIIDDGPAVVDTQEVAAWEPAEPVANRNFLRPILCPIVLCPERCFSSWRSPPLRLAKPSAALGGDHSGALMLGEDSS